MQRVRAGLTGLAAIFLMVLIAAAGMKPSRVTGPSATHGETLAVLGVAPGASGETTRRTVASRVSPTPVARRPATT